MLSNTAMRRSALVCASVVAMIIHGTANAQEAESSTGQADDTETQPDIVVTATRREETLSKIPLSVVATSQEQLDKQGIRSADDLMRMTPSVTFGQSSQFYGTGQSNISIRGIQSTSGIPTTGIYIDDTPIQTRTGVSPSLTNAYPQIFDLDRVEVLRGPQGTLFGTASLGGAVRFITPEPVFSGYKLYGRSEAALTEKGSPSYEAGLAFGAPLVEDKVGFRASAWYRHDGGYVDRLDRTSRQVAEKDINSADNFAARLAIGLRPAENVTITPSLFYQNVSIDDSSLVELRSSQVGDLRNGLFSRPELHKDEFWLPGLKAVADFGGVTLISNTSYITRKTKTQSDDDTLNLAIWSEYYDPAPPPGFEENFAYTDNKTSQTGFTQEVRLQNADSGRFNWVVGAFYSRSTVKDEFGGANTKLLENINFGLARFGAPPISSVSELLGVEPYQGLYVVYQKSKYVDIQKSVFAQVDYEIVPRVRLTAGARYTNAKFRLNNFVAGPLVVSDGVSVEDTSTSSPVTPKFGISFQADRNNLFYANIAKGVRGNGVSEPAGIRCVDDGVAIGFDPLATREIKPDSLWSYEIGSKNRFAGGRISLDASAYHVDWNNVQDNLVLPICQVHTTFNLGKAKIDGFDVSMVAAPVDNLTLSGSLSYINARFSGDLLNTSGEVIRKSGEPLDVAPITVHVSGQYDVPLGSSEGYLRADFTHSTHNDKPQDLTSPLVDPIIPRRPATSQLDLRAGVEAGSADISLFVTNVLNAHPWLGLVHSTANDPVLRSVTFRPRTFGLTVSVRR